MILQNVRRRETQTGSPLLNTPQYDWLLTRFTNTRQDTHLVEGDFHSVPEVESVAGTVVKFCESYSNSHMLALADEDGMMYLFNSVLSGRDCLMTKWSVHKNAIFDLEWVPFSAKIVTASGHQVACLVDITTKQTIDTFKGHVSSLKTIVSRRTDPYVFATGGRDGSICIWDPRVSRRSNTIPSSNEIRHAHSSGSRSTRKSTSQSITGLCFQDETTLVSCASNDSSIKVWDLRRSYKTHKSNPLAKYKFTYHGKSRKHVGYSGICMDFSRSFIYANCIDDCIYQFSGINYQDAVISSFKGHKNKTFFVKSALSPDGNYLLTGSSDHNARIYSTNISPHLRDKSYSLHAHTEEVTSVAWSFYDTCKVATISDDDTLKIWRLGETTLHADISGECKDLSPRESERLTGIRDRAAPLVVKPAVSPSSSSTLTSTAAHDIHVTSTPHDTSVAPASVAPATPSTHTPPLPTQTSPAFPPHVEEDGGVLPWPTLNGLNIQPKVCSPRKLMVSPRKGYILGPSHSCGPGATVPLHNPCTQAKRKLIDLDFSSPSKRLRECAAHAPSCIPSVPLSPSTLSPIRINNSSLTLVNVTPSSSPAVANCKNLDFSSPTANLPNSVLDAQTPRRHGKENSCTPKPVALDWLSQLSKDKVEKFNSSSPQPISSAATPSRAKTKASAAKTPTNKKKVSQTLLKYFSPTARTPSTSDSKNPTSN